MAYNLHLYDRLAEGTAFRRDFTRHVPDWRRSIRARGGYWMGGGTITSETMGGNEIVNLFNTALGRRVVEQTSRLSTWEGEIVRLDLTYRGVTYTRTLDSRRWQNKVKVRYGPDTTNDETAYDEVTSSSNIYGESVYIDVVGSGYDTTSAIAARDRRLLEFAYPRTWPAGGLASTSEAPDTTVQLHFNCVGYVFSMNRRYQETDIAAGNVSDQISTLVGNSEFVTAGRIEANTLQWPINVAGMTERLWDLIDEAIQLGDASGSRWVGGVYRRRRFSYELAQTTVTHYWRSGRLLDKNSVGVRPTLILPNIIVQISDVPSFRTPPGGFVWDNPRNAYIEEVVFTAPDQYSLIPYSGGGL